MSCPICLEEINELETTTCNHNFCKSCINKWLEEHNNCPLCRCNLKDNMPTQEQLELMEQGIPLNDISSYHHSVRLSHYIDSNSVAIEINGQIIRNRGVIQVENPVLNISDNNVRIEVSNITYTGEVFEPYMIYEVDTQSIHTRNRAEQRARNRARRRNMRY